jgi:hypothetical protein
MKANHMIVARIYPDDDFPEYMPIPSKNQMCDECGGNGKVDNPAFSNGITQEDRDEMGEESFENYMDGRYDVTCPCCKGQRVIKVADVSQCTMYQKRFLVRVRQDEKSRAEFEKEGESEAAYHRACAGYFA